MFCMQTRLTPGANMPNQHAAMPTSAFTPARDAMRAPRYAAMLKSGPGIACVCVCVCMYEYIHNKYTHTLTHK